MSNASASNPGNWLQSLGFPASDPVPAPSSPLRFEDGGQYRIEIPSTEGPRSLQAVIEEGRKRDVPLHRVSQGSGIMLMTDEEIIEMLAIGREAGIEVNLFIGPRATFDVGAQVFSPAGKALGLSARGADQLRFALEDLQRGVELGLKSVLVSDLGVLQVIGKMKQTGDLGATTINIPSDLTIPQIAGIRMAIAAPIDFYVEAPDNIGGFIRYFEIPELIRVAAPVYLKFGLRNSPDIYPSGTHIEGTVLALSRERVRRASLAMQTIARSCPDAVMSPLRKPVQA